MRISSILKLAAVAAIALVVAMVAVEKSTDVNAYRSILAKVVKAATGRDVEVHGALSLKLSATPSIVAEDVTFSNASWGSRPDMAHVRRIEASIGLLPLLAHEVRIDRLLLVDPDILLEEDKKGHANWRFEEEDGSGSDSQEGGSPHMRFDIVEVTVKGGRVEWRAPEGRSSQVIDLQRLTLDTPGVMAPVGLNVTGGWNGHTFDISGVLGPTGDTSGSDAETVPYPVKLKAVLPNLVLLLDGTVTNAPAGPELAVKVSADTPHVTEAGRLLDLELPPLGAARVSFAVKGPVDAFRISDVDAAIGRKDQLNIVARGGVTAPLDGSGVDLSVGVEADSLAGIGRAFEQTLPGVGPVKLSWKLNDTKGGWRLSGLTGMLGKSDLAGEIGVTTGRTRPAVRVRLSSGSVDLGEWQAAMAEPGKTPAHHPDGRVFSSDPLPLAAFDAADVDLDWHIDRAVLGALVAETVTVPLELKDRRLTVSPDIGNLTGGQASAHLVVDGAATPPTVALDAKADKIELGRVLNGLGVTDTVDGARTELRVDVKGSGDSLRAIMAKLKGETLLVSDRAKVAHLQADILAVDLLRQLLPTTDNSKTDMRCLVSRFVVSNGLAKSETLLFDTSRMTVVGQGSINLATEGLDLTLAPRAKEPSLVSLAVPLDVGGTLASPSVSPDQGAIAKGVVSAVGGLALGPFGLLVPLVSGGSGDTNPCVAAIDHARHPASRGKSGQGGSKSSLGHMFKDIFGD